MAANKPLKNILDISLALAFVVLSIFQTAGCTKKSHGDELILGTNTGYPPYESVNDKGELEGFDIDVANAIAKKLNKKLVFKDLSFDALILGLNQNKFDFIMGGLSITPSREKEIAMVPYQGDVMKSYALIFSGKIPANVKSVDDIKNTDNKTIAVLTGTIMEEYLRKFPEIISKPLESTSEILMDIKHQESVAALLEPHIADEVTIKHAGLKKLEIPLPPAEWVKGNGIGIKRNNAELIKKVQKAVDDLKIDGTIKELEKKWFKDKVK